MVLSFQMDFPSSECTESFVVFRSRPVILSAASSFIMADFIWASPKFAITLLENSVWIVPPVAEPNMRVFMFATPDCRDCMTALLAVNAFTSSVSIFAFVVLRFSMVAYVILASVADNLFVSKSPTLAETAFNCFVIFIVCAVTSFVTTTSKLTTLDESILSIQSPSTVPLSVVILSTVSLVSSYFCTYSSKVRTAFASSQVLLSGASGYSTIFTILCFSFILLFSSSSHTTSPILYSRILYSSEFAARSTISQPYEL